MKPDTSFWHEMRRLITINPIIIDRPNSQPHPPYPELIYPFDYRHLENMTAGDGGRTDAWISSLISEMLTGILCTIDKIKYDAEIKH